DERDAGPLGAGQVERLVQRASGVRRVVDRDEDVQEHRGLGVISAAAPPPSGGGTGYTDGRCTGAGCSKRARAARTARRGGSATPRRREAGRGSAPRPWRRARGGGR